MKNNQKLLLAFFAVIIFQYCGAQQTGPVRLVVAGISHGHNGWIFNRKPDSIISIVGIYEADTALARQLMELHHIDRKLFYHDLGKMLDELKPEGILAFGTTYEHVSVVEAAAPRHIDVMVEKPLAANWQQAKRIEALAARYKINVLTNYETSWYPTTDKCRELAYDTAQLGPLRKVVVHDGHAGPRAIGVAPYFFKWLTDPVKNGGGALTDFGCYGANIMTMLTYGEVPLRVTAVTQHLQPEVYPRVDDEATILIEYAHSQCIIQASWNWPYSRKDMEVYGTHGYAITSDNRHMRVRKGNADEQQLDVAPSDTQTETDPFRYFADVIRSRIAMPSFGVYTLDNNMLVMRILDAARRSAATGRSVTP